MERVDITKKWDTNSCPKDWNKYDFWWLLDKLENIPTETLIKICELPQIQLTFTNSKWKDVPRDEIINALVADFTPDDLIPAIVSQVYGFK